MNEKENTSWKSKRASPYTYIEKELLKSKVWLKLSGTAKGVYMIFLLKRQIVKTNRKKGREGYQCVNERELIFTYPEARKEYGIIQATFTEAIDQLVERGFIDIVKSVHGMRKQSTIYGLSERWRKYGTPEFEQVSRRKGDHIGGRRGGYGCTKKKKLIQDVDNS